MGVSVGVSPRFRAHALPASVLETDTVSAGAQQPEFRLGHRPALDGLRGLACLLVIGYHLVPGRLPGGYLGVTLFFVLSGFLITTLLTQEWLATGSIKLRAFYARRTLRLLPALLLFLLVCWLAARALLAPEILQAAGADIVSILLYYYNWRRALNPGLHPIFLEHAWSLAVEEQFYLVWPIVLFTLLRCRVRRRWLLLVVVGGLAASASARGLLWHGRDSYPRVYYCTDTRADALLTGCLVGLLASWNYLPRTRLMTALLQLAGLAGFVVLVYHLTTRAGHLDNDYLYHWGFLVCALSMGLLLGSLLLAPLPPLARCFEWPLLVWVGRLSYGLYLWHFPLWMYLEPLVPGWKGRILLLLLSAALASASYYGLEKPLLRLKSVFGK